MNDEVTFAGHRVQGCRGRWIDIGSLAGPAWKCPECRVTIQSLDALEEPPEPWPTPERPAPRGAIWLVAGTILLAAGLVALMFLNR